MNEYVRRLFEKKAEELRVLAGKYGLHGIRLADDGNIEVSGSAGSVPIDKHVFEADLERILGLAPANLSNPYEWKKVAEHHYHNGRIEEALELFVMLGAEFEKCLDWVNSSHSFYRLQRAWTRE